MKNTLILITLLFAAMAFGDSVIVVPDADPLSTLLGLIAKWSSVSPLVLASSVVVIITQAVKKFVPGFAYTKIVVVVGGIIYGVIQSLITGMTFINAVVFVMLTSGGAMALYDVFRSPLNSVMGMKK
jgi:hypothetical protein